MPDEEGWWVGVRPEDRTLPSATLHEAAGRIGGLPSEIKPVVPASTVFGPAFPVSTAPGHNLWLHRAIYAAPAGSVLVVDVGSGNAFGYWGEIMNTAAVHNKLGGLILNGCVRDHVALARMGFPVFSAGLCIRGTGKDPRAAGSLGAPISIADVSVHAGDLVAGDVDGVVVIPGNRVTEVIAAGHQRERAEKDVLDRLRQGESTLDIYDLPPMSAGGPERRREGHDRQVNGR